MTLARGATGPEVAALQERLAGAGYPVKVDGVFGSETARALASFQESANLKADEVYGDKTRGVLEPPLPRDNPSRAVREVVAALSGGAGQGGEARMQMLPPQVASGPAPGIGSDPDRNVMSVFDPGNVGMMRGDMEAERVNADMANLGAGAEPLWGTGARLPLPRGVDTATANSPFAAGIEAYDPRKPPQMEAAYDPLASMRVPAQPMSTQQFDDRWSIRPPPQQQTPDPLAGLTSNPANASDVETQRQRALALAAARRRQAEGRAPKPDVTEPYSGSLLPFSKDSKGNVRFDPDAGLVGSIKRAVTLPGDVYSGQVDPNSPEATGRVMELATLASPMNPAAASGERVIPGAVSALRRERVEPPTAEALKAAGGAGYDAAREMGVHYSSDAVRKMVDEIRFNLNNDGILAELAPKTFSILEKLGTPPAGSTAPLSGIDAARRAFGKAARDFNNPTEQEAAGRVIDGIDRFVEVADPATVMAGPAAAAGATIRDARGNYAAAKRSERLQGIEDDADLNAKVANSGQNTENAIRQRTKSLLQNPKQIAGYSPQEVAAIRRVAEGTATANTLRFVGNLLGGGGGLGAVISGATGGIAGGAFGGPAGMIAGSLAPALGMGAKKVATALARSRLGAADEMARMRSPMYQQMAKDAPVAEGGQAGISAVVRALMLAHPEWFGQPQR